VETRTIHGALKLLAADFAGQLSHTGLLIERDSDGLFVIAEEAGKNGDERFALDLVSLACAQTLEGVPFWGLAAFSLPFFCPAEC